MSLKIIGGEFRGRNLQSVRGLGTRPLLGQVREALFNILGGFVEGKEVWDLFAGTGASGLEALSRGASRVLFVEKNNQALKILRANIEMLGEDAQQRTHVMKADAWQLPTNPIEGDAAEVPPHVVFFDPPYSAVTEDPTRAAYLAQQLVPRMAPGGILCFHFMDGSLDRDDFDSGQDVEIRRWGKSAVALIEAPAGADQDDEGLVEDTAYES